MWYGSAWVEYANLKNAHPLTLKFFSHFPATVVEQFNKVKYTEAIEAVMLLWDLMKNHQKAQRFVGLPDIFQSKKICIDYKSAKYFVWDTIKQEESQYHPDVLFNLIDDPDARGAMRNEAPISKLVFDPYKPHTKVWNEIVEGHNLITLNLYRAPVWHDKTYKEKDLLNVKEEYPPLFINLFQYLFPVPEEQNILLDWMALAIFDHPVSALVLRSGRGNGKTMLKQFLYHLIGNSYESLQQIDKQFNFDYRNKRIIGMDDNTNIGSIKGNQIRKSLGNPTISYEKKHEQTIESDMNHASFIFISNISTPFYFEHDERRAVCPTMRHERIDKYMPQETMNWWWGYAQPVEKLSAAHIQLLRGVGSMLLARYAQRKPYVGIELKAGNFWVDVIQSLPSFKRFLVGWIWSLPPTRTMVDYEEVKATYKTQEGYMGKVNQWNTLCAWMLGDFQLWGEKLVMYEGGQPVISHSDRTFAANPKLCRGKEE